MVGAKAGLASLWGGRRDHPAPRAPGSGAGLALHAALDHWRVRARRRFDRLFLRGSAVHLLRAERRLFGRLADIGLVERLAPSIVRACARVVAFDGRLVATDGPWRRSHDQVFPLMLEQAWFARTMRVAAGDHVLEPFVGSGVNALFAADRAASVTGVDLNPRALAFARFNEALAPGAVPLELREGSLFDPLPEGRRYDLVLANPPFEPVPPGADHFLHSHGGADGLDVVRAFLAGLPGRLAPDGRLEMVSFSPGGPRGSLLPALVRDALPACRIEVTMLGEEALGAWAHRTWRRRNDVGGWLGGLAARGLRVLDLLHVRAAPGPSEVVLRPAGPALAAACATSAAWWPAG